MFDKQIVKSFNPVTIIAFAQLLGTTLWFSANSAADDLMRSWNISVSDMAWLTNAVQLGFIVGTLLISLGGVADRFSASKIFVFSSVLGALFNGLFGLFADGLVSGVIYRFLVGLMLAGIYPIGMKMIVSWVQHNTGYALAQLVAMLTLGTALPHALRALSADFPWQFVIFASSILAMIGAGLIFKLGDGPYLVSQPVASLSGGKSNQRSTALSAFRSKKFRGAAWGYFGHMWELYAFWTVVPLLLSRMFSELHLSGVALSWISFAVISIGSLGSLLGGFWAARSGSTKVAGAMLGLSLACAVTMALLWRILPLVIAMPLILVWGASVVADSPHFSALSARACPSHLVGSALALQNAIGFAITIVSISLLLSLFERVGLDSIWLLVPGPLVGLFVFGKTYFAKDDSLAA